VRQVIPESVPEVHPTAGPGCSTVGMTDRQGTGTAGTGTEPAARGGALGSLGGELEGPWEVAFWVLMQVPLRSKSNFRRGRDSGWRAYRGFEDEVALEVRRFLPDSWAEDSPATPLPRRPRYASVIAARSAIDAGNYSKSVLDACEGIVFTNDAQVQVTTALSERGRRDPYLLVAFAQLPPGSDPHHAAAAGSGLLQACVSLLDTHRPR
jgi:hypothetical protein